MTDRVERLIDNLGLSFALQIALVEVLYLWIGVRALVSHGDWRYVAAYGAGALVGVALWPLGVRHHRRHLPLARAAVLVVVLVPLAAAFELVPYAAWVLPATVAAGVYTMNMACVYSDPRVAVPRVDAP